MKGKKQRKVIHNRKRRPTHPGELLREEILPVSDVAGHPGTDIPAGTLKNILKQAGFEKEDAK